MNIRLLLLGCGTVGGELVHLLRRRQEEVRRRWDLDFEIGGILRRSRQTDELSGIPVFTDIDEALDAVKPHIVVELVGGVDPAFSYLRKAILAGAHIVTANKAVLAAHGHVLYELARQHRRLLLAEASVGGAIPILRTLHTSLGVDRVQRIAGVLNGTCNYILGRMEHDQIPFSDALSDAQRLGYAEPDPTLDIDGGDTAHKTVVLSQLAFGNYEPTDVLEYRGITDLRTEDFEASAQLGLRPRLIGLLESRGSILVRYVGPALLPDRHPLARLEGPENGVEILFEEAGSLFLSGPGAGPAPTAATVVGDILEIARVADAGHALARWEKPSDEGPESVPFEDLTFSYYIRTQVLDRPGVLAALAEALARQQISIRSVEQPYRHASSSVPLYFTTDPAPVGRLLEALRDWEQLDANTERPVWLPILEDRLS
ncbi:MAG: homoserine dehydrogenase [Candidatus Dadabacteria bacterium]|nr:MAG: homoserine dehydrogenase [Candidatus Dadabacteria bacterium]